MSGTWSWRKNLGNNTFGPEQAIVNPPPLGWLNDVNVHLVDMNGDGLLDFVWYSRDWTGNPDQYHYRLNWWANVGPNASGNLEFRNPASFTPCGLPRPASGCQDLAVLTVPMPFSGHITQLIDMNGDGFLDFAHVARYPFPGSANGFPEWRYLPGAVDAITGQIYFRPAVVMLNPTPVPEYFITYDIYLADVNGDGLPDVLRGVEGQSPVYQPNVKGIRFGSPIPLVGAPDIYGPTLRKSIRLGDINSDGFFDILRGNAGDYTYWSWTPAPVLNHRLLKVVKSPFGGSEIVDYQRQRIENGGGVGWAVNQLSRDAADGQLMSITNYAYAGGLVAGWPWNEFRGFATVTVTEPPDHANQRHRTITRFHQDDAKKGRVDFAETVRASDGAIFARERFTYAAGPTLPGVMRVDLVGHQRQIWDGTASATSPISFTGTSTFRDYFDNYGQAREVTTTSLWADSVSAQIGSIATRFVTTDFAYNTAAYIVNKPSRTQTTVGGTKTSETWFDYDGLANGAAPTKGDLTKETRWLSGGANPVVQHFYDNKGRRIGTIDPNGNICASTGYTTAFEYSGAVNVVKETNALCRETTKTYWRINTDQDDLERLSSVAGAYAVPTLLATVTDVNGVRTDSYFDALGRPKATVLPPDTEAAPTTVWSYSVTGTAPSSTTVQKRESVGGGTLDSVTYADGLGRTIQTKSEAETAGQWLTVDTRYNPRGLAESVSAPYATATSNHAAADASKPKVTTLYDPIRRPIEVWNPDGTVRRTAYARGVVTTTDEKNNQTLRTMDVLGRLIKVREPSSGGDTLYSYDTFDASGNNTQTIADALNNITTTVFDTLGRKKSQIDPDLGTWNYTYDLNGNLLRQTDAKQQVTIYTYDKLNRVTSKITSPPDNTPPVISAVASGSIGTTTATISWTTDEVSDSQVEYGTSTTYGSSTPLDGSLVTSHGVVLSGLSNSTLYHYRVKSKDVLGNLATSGDFTFTIGSPDTTPPTISNVTAGSITSSGATITWTTNEASDTQVEYGTTTSYGSSTTLNTSMVTSHIATLSGLSASTLYHYRVKSRDAAGNLAISGDFTFTTAAPPYTLTQEPFAWVNTPTPLSFAGDDNAIALSLPFSFPFYGQSYQQLYVSTNGLITFGAANTAYVPQPIQNPVPPNGFIALFWRDLFVGQHQVSIASSASEYVIAFNGVRDLCCSTIHTFQVVLRPDGTILLQYGAIVLNVPTTFGIENQDGSEGVALPSVSSNTAFKLTPTDTTPPTISNVAAGSITSSGATIAWTTNEASDTQVEYGTTTSYGSSTTLNTAMVTSHSAALSGLSASMLYHYRVKSRDAAGNLTTSGDFTFTTAASPVLTVNKSGNDAARGSVTSSPAGINCGATCTASFAPGTSVTLTAAPAAGATFGGFSGGCVSATTTCIFTITANATVTATFNDTQAPTAPSGLAATVASSTQINLTWTASTDNIGVTGYRVERCQGASCTNFAQIATPTGASFNNTGLTTGTTYRYRVRAADAAGNLSAYSNIASGTTTSNDTTPPTISNVAAGSITSSGATIAWTTNEASDTQVEYGTTTSYGSSTPLNTAMVTSHSATLSGLSPSTLYNYRVKSRDAASNLATSGNFTFTTASSSGGPDLTQLWAAIATITSTSITINDVVRNIGTVNAGAFDVGFYLSTDTSYQTTDTFLCKRSLSSLAAGTSNPPSGTAATTCSISGVASGSYYLLAVADSGQVVAETNETNNTFSTGAPIGPDLIVSLFSASKSGNTLTIQSAAKNQGNRDAGAFDLGFYLSTDTTLNTASDPFVCKRSIASLAAGVSDPPSSVTTISCTLPAVPAGSYYVIGFADSTGVITEYNESNNTMMGGNITMP